jgi:putative membrane protein
MKRRAALLAFSAGALPILAPMAMRAYAQAPANMIPRDLGQYRTMTLMVGSLALQSSQLATQRATMVKVKEFAGFETAEQLTIAQVLNDAPAPPVAQLDSHACGTVAGTQQLTGGSRF